MINYNSEDYINYRIQKAKETLLEVDLLIENEFWNTSITRMYYACFYAIGALLVRENIEISSHSGLRQKFGEYFIKTGVIDKSLGKHFSDLFEKRHKGDYNDFFEFDKDTVERLYPKTVKLIETIELILKEN